MHMHLAVGHTIQSDYNVIFDDPALAVHHFLGLLRTLVGVTGSQEEWEQTRAEIMDEFLDNSRDFEWGISSEPFRVALFSCPDTCTKRHTN
jgi:hypothetical protein